MCPVEVVAVEEDLEVDGVGVVVVDVDYVGGVGVACHWWGAAEAGDGEAAGVDGEDVFGGEGVEDGVAECGHGLPAGAG